MKCSLSEHGGTVKNRNNGADTQAVGKPTRAETLTANGSFAATQTAGLVRLATDTNLTVTIGGIAFLMPVGVELIDLEAGTVVTIATA